MKPFLTGLCIGIGVGILFAPMSGRETRRRIGNKAEDIADSAREFVGNSRDRVRTTISAIRGKAERIMRDQDMADSHTGS